MTPDLIRTSIDETLLRGAHEVERTVRGLLPHRLPEWARIQSADPQLAMAEGQPAGIRLVFRTRATEVELDVVATKRIYPGMPTPPDGVYDLLVDGHLTAQASASAGDTLTVNMLTGGFEHRPGRPSTLRFSGLSDVEKDVEIWLPHNETSLLVELRTNAPVLPAPPHGRPVWLHHGSSISHGSNAASPSSTWAALAARLGCVELVNLGMGGSALLDPFMARTMRDTAADLLSVKIGINLVNKDVMRRRAFTPAVHGFLDTLRDGHPSTPLLVISPIMCPIHEDTPGPSLLDPASLEAGQMQYVAAGDPDERGAGKLALIDIREELARIVAERAAEDPHLHYLDGLELYGPEDADELPLADRLHPDTATHQRMGQRFAELALTNNGPLTAPS